MTYKIIPLLLTVYLGYAFNGSPNQNTFRKLNKTVQDTVETIHCTAFTKESYTTNSNHTLLLELNNKGAELTNITTSILLPKGFKLITISSLNSVEENTKKTMLISFFIAENTTSGSFQGNLTLLSGTKIVSNCLLSFTIENNYSLRVTNVSAPQNVQAGEPITATYLVQNTGNVEQTISLNSGNTLDGSNEIVLGPAISRVITVSQKTASKMSNLRAINTSLEVVSITSGKSYKAYSTTTVFPNKIEKKDAFFRFPIRTSLFFNSYTDKKDHYSTMSTEISGTGYLDYTKNHAIDFIFRGPRQDKIQRFGVTDQYSLKYSFKNKTRISLGDQAYDVDRLGFTNRFGMGARIDHNIKRWTLSAFYNKPRLYNFNEEELYGTKLSYHVSDSMHTGISLVHANNVLRNFNPKVVNKTDHKVDILTANINFQKKRTLITAEASLSNSGTFTDFAVYLILMQRWKNISYTGNFTTAGKNYFGTLNNSIQFSNSLTYSMRKWTVGVGQAVYKVNKRLDPLYYAAEPYFENYFMTIGYRFNQNHHLNFRVDRRIREDQLEPKNYYYKENGLNYRYSFNTNFFNAFFNGRIAKTQNLLSNSIGYNKTYSHNLSLSYRFPINFRINTNISHNYSNRYGRSSKNLNSYRYSIGFNCKLKQIYRFGANYISGFSPEETHLQREYINVNLAARISKNHQIEVRANYFESPAVINRKELLVYGKYSYTFGIPLKKIVEQGSVIGQVITHNDSINKKGIRIIAAGKTVITNKKGQFELHNLPVGKNFIFIDQASLPKNVIATSKKPQEIVVKEKKVLLKEIEVVYAAAVNGIIIVSDTFEKQKDLGAYLKLSNSSFTYFTESNMEGKFYFQQIVPGEYELKVIQFKENTNLIAAQKAAQFTLEEGEQKSKEIRFAEQQQLIKFNNRNFKIGSNE